MLPLWTIVTLARLWLTAHSIAARISRFEPVDQLAPDLYGDALREHSELPGGSRPKCCPIAVADEITCLRIIGYLATGETDPRTARQPSVHKVTTNSGHLIFPLADSGSDYTEALVALSNVLLNTGKPAEAADVIGKAVAANPSDGKLLMLAFSTRESLDRAIRGNSQAGGEV
jgi:hypothetical protein